MPGKTEAQAVTNAITSSLDGIVRCLEGLDTAELNWRPPVATGNSLAVIATHALGNAAQNIVEILGGDDVGRVRDEEFATEGDVADAVRERWSALRPRLAEVIAGLADAEWEREHEHYTDRRLTGREVMLLVHRHATEHLGEAQLVRDLALAARD